MKGVRVALSLLVAATLTNCSSVAVKTDFDPTANFMQYKTFDFMPHRTKPGGNPLQ